MQIESHDVLHEFPEFSVEIARLQARDEYFARLSAEYNRLDEEIRRLEEASAPVSDAYLESAKLRRVAMKDDLYRMLRAESARA